MLESIIESMTIPDNITKDHLLKAIEKIDNDGIPEYGQSQYYDVLYNEKKYPPKLIVSYANLFANGEELDRNAFEGGLKTPAFALLEKEGFKIAKKNGITDKYPDLEMFFGQIKHKDFRTNHFQKNYRGLKVKVGFGQGTLAHIPWIAFLGKNQEVQNGIYPVLLYFRKLDLLFVCYGVSETKIPKLSWNIQDKKSIASYFNENNLGKPKHYGTSLIRAVYSTSTTLNIDSILLDIDSVIGQYKSQLGIFEVEPSIGMPPPPQTPKTIIRAEDNSNERYPISVGAKFAAEDFIAVAQLANLKLDEKLGIRFIASLLTKPFVILTGLSGSGKTKLAQAFAQWLCEEVNGNGTSEQYCLVPVGADWTNREPLLGFPNALNADEYVYPDNGVLKLILHAIEEPSKPHFLILDEMNLSHVERYFADFLSAMESKCSIALHDGKQEGRKPPSSILLPKNLFIIGTVNIDETTYMFSPKVLDRASVIEFRVTFDEMESYLNGYKALDLNSLNSKGAEMGSDFISLAGTSIEGNVDFMTNNLLEFFDVLKKGGAEFGYRSASEILKYAYIIKKLGVSWNDDEIFDTAIMQKLLPKVHGSRRKLEPHLKLMAELCLKENALFDEMVKQFEADRTIDYTQVKYPVSFEKIMRMYRNLLSNGFTSYAEA